MHNSCVSWINCRDNFLQLDLFYKELKVQKVTESVKYDAGNFFGKQLV